MVTWTLNEKLPKSTFTRAISNTSLLAIFQLDSTYLCLSFNTAHPMSTNHVTTRAKNAAQHPGLLIPKQTHHTSGKVMVVHRAKEDAKREKEDIKKANIKRVAEFEQNQADKDAMEWTPQVVTKPNPMVKDLTPRKKNSRSRATTEFDDDLPAPPPPPSVW